MGMVGTPLVAYGTSFATNFGTNLAMFAIYARCLVLVAIILQSGSLRINEIYAHVESINGTTDRLHLCMDKIFQLDGRIGTVRP